MTVGPDWNFFLATSREISLGSPSFLFPSFPVNTNPTSRGLETDGNKAARMPLFVEIRALVRFCPGTDAVPGVGAPSCFGFSPESSFPAKLPVVPALLFVS